MFEPIASGLSPNTELDDILLALRLILQPWKWNDQRLLIQLRDWFSQRFFSKKVYLLNAGRSALYLLLKAAGIGKGDEVVVQAFTCIGAVEPIVWVGAKPIYVDIEKETFNLAPADLARKITGKSKAIIVQHTFGIPADIAELDKIARHHGLVLIEDCAHALGARIELDSAKDNGSEIGTLGDAAFFSFGRDKVVSSVFGGAAVVHHSSKFAKIDTLSQEPDMPSVKWIFQQLLHPLASGVILPTYKLQLGKVLLVFLQKVNLLSKPYAEVEYRGERPTNYPQKLPPVLAALALNQLSKLDKFNKKRRSIAAKYGKIKKGSIYLRFPVLVDNPSKLYGKAKKQGIILGRWYSNIIDPAGTDLKVFSYKKGSCPVAESVAKSIINLPTYPRMNKQDILRVKNFIDLQKKH